MAGAAAGVCKQLDTRAETERLYGLLSEGGSEAAPLQDMFWGAYWGTCLDRFGVRWMFNGPGPNG